MHRSRNVRGLEINDAKNGRAKTTAFLKQFKTMQNAEHKNAKCILIARIHNCYLNYFSHEIYEKFRLLFLKLFMHNGRSRPWSALLRCCCAQNVRNAIQIEIVAVRNIITFSRQLLLAVCVWPMLLHY